MSKLRSEYNRLISEKYNVKQIEQLIFLYSFLNKKNNLFNYWNFIKEINNKYSDKYLEQLIKCITHNTPYRLFMNKKISISTLNELRRYLEDSLKNNNEDDLFYYIAEVMIKYNWNSKMVYQFRRFIKCDKPINSIEAYNLLNFIINNKLYNWIILATLYDLYINTSIKTLNDFIEGDYLKEWIKKYKITNKNILLIELREYVDKIILEEL